MSTTNANHHAIKDQLASKKDGLEVLAVLVGLLVLLLFVLPSCC